MAATVSVYFLFDGTDLVYVGVTRNLARRIKQHRVDGWRRFDGWGAFRAADRVGRQMELFYIARHRPRYNRIERSKRPLKYLGKAQRA